MIDNNDDDDVGLSPAHRALLDDLDGPPLPRAVEDRLRQRVLASVGVGIAVGALASTSASAAASTTTAATTAAATTTTTAAVATKATLGAVVAKSVAGVIGAAVIVGGVTIATTAPTVQTPPTKTAATTTAAPTAAPTATNATNDEGTAGDTEPVAATTGTTMPAETAPVSMSPPPPVTVSKRKAPSLEVATSEPAVDEVTLLDRARRALAANDPARALDLVETAAAQTPSSSFAEERTALQVLALVGVGRRDEASALAQRFFSQWPVSLLAPRVRAALR